MDTLMTILFGLIVIVFGSLGAYNLAKFIANYKGKKKKPRSVKGPSRHTTIKGKDTSKR